MMEESPNPPTTPEPPTPTDARPAGPTDAKAGFGDKFRQMGPSWIAGAIAAGPGTMASVITAGALFGFSATWVIVLSAVLGAFSVYLAMRLGLFTGKKIVQLVKDRIGKGWAWILTLDVVIAAGIAQFVIMFGLAAVSAAITGVDARLWAVIWAVVLAVGLATGGYRFLEIGAKVVVSAVVLLFVGSLLVIRDSFGGVQEAFQPVFPTDVSGALVIAGVLGGAVHITLITMQSYTMKARRWDMKDYGLARFDVVSSLLVAFGIYSLAIFFVSAAVLHNNPAVDGASLSALGASQALGPIAGPYAKWLFLLGLWGAAVSTLGGNTVVPPYLLADQLGWDTDVKDTRYRALLVVFALISALGVFIPGDFFPKLVLMLGIGLVGTPFAIAIVLYLLNLRRVTERRTGAWTNVAGFVLFAVAFVTGWNFIYSRAKDNLTDPLTLFVLLLGAFLTVATLVLAIKWIVNREIEKAQ